MSTFSNEIACLPFDLQALMLDELHNIASRFMNKESAGHTLQATALVNEAYVKLADKTVHFVDKQHFVAIAAQQMRRILVDSARQKQAAKRGGRPIKITLEESAIASPTELPNQQIELLYINELLDELASFDARASKIFEIKLFSMLGNEDIAKIMELSLATVERDIKAAKAWFKLQIRKN
ncbi:ECF-type sigma factor [Glaciecola sp. SC05]|uniref:ECF-type sigma factor n=1 Tax=Glaciecola sp. SC05 TaxID=1987355 RepID=UPI003527645B